MVADGLLGQEQSAGVHTNYSYHLAAALSVLDVPAERDAVAAKVATWQGDALEAAIVAAGGCAAVMRTEAQWAAQPAGEATRERASRRSARRAHRARRAPCPCLPRLPARFRWPASASST